MSFRSLLDRLREPNDSPTDSEPDSRIWPPMHWGLCGPPRIDVSKLCSVCRIESRCRGVPRWLLEERLDQDQGVKDKEQDLLAPTLDEQQSWT